MNEGANTVAIETPDTYGPGVEVMTIKIGPAAGTLRLRLHLESRNRFGSVKDRTAYALVRSFERDGRLGPGGHVVESTSGNLGIALAGICAERGYRCTLAVDDTTAPSSLRRMTELGAELIRVTATDAAFGVSLRLAAVRDFLAAHPAAVWTNQYDNPAGPEIHAATTGPALIHQPGLPVPQAVAVPVSTGGVLAGVAVRVRADAPQVRILAVDAVGSAATGGAAMARPAKLPGFGSALRSGYLRPEHFDEVAYVGDEEAAIACRIIGEHAGLSLGGSAGAAVLAAVRAALADPGLTDIACLCPDGGDRYQTLIYGADTEKPWQVASSPELLLLYDMERTEERPA